MANWERLAAQSNGLYEEQDYQQAAYRLMMEQVIYAGDRGGRVPYELVTRHLGAFRDVFEQFGITITHNPHHGYVVAIPRHAFGARMRLEETRLALLLRRVYDDRINAVDIVDGEAFVTLEELEQLYKDLLGRQLPDRGEMRELVRSLKRNGMAREIDAADDQPFQIAIRPAITDILGQTALLQLAAYGVDPEVMEEEADDEAA
ncbi:DUF4194 domain-containing protein [Luteimonas sp. MC1825]|uniref:DUF4194 domain-containing protein n=1 Tax=Luteimonas sp. MC1825 TaxID=2761107 RepID=UPI00160F7004|nr:DUF4194 domain-containing protein [Luteimonas sp. MC1825]MBB6600313.1 DUF4194 domain-containing protein [Luteimonas sp. MC1825]QOC87991.1 DUF4194 domain-containing protein [Luteimonas sp. MC1825]